MKYIIFDLSDVLLSGVRDSGVALAKKHNLNNELTHAVPWSDIKNPLLIPIAEEFLNGNTTEDEYLTEILKQFPQLGSADSLKRYIRNNFKEVEGTRKIILKLKRLNYNLALLSVNAKEWVEYYEKKFDFHCLFNVIMYSYETKVSKPNPEAFKQIIKKLNTPPEQCLFIDDSAINIKAAKNFGMHTVLFTTATKLDKELKKLLPKYN